MSSDGNFHLVMVWAVKWENKAVLLKVILKFFHSMTVHAITLHSLWNGHKCRREDNP